METMERDVIFFILDISGYTRFIFANEKEVSHSQIIVRELITILLDEVKLPLEIIRLEGDAVFMYAFRDDPAQPWNKVSKNLVFNLMTFFRVFTNKISELTVHKICNCTACNHIEDLKLKAVVHSGRAAFFNINGLQELTGTDVIIAHRLLKNSVESDEYILMTEQAFDELVLPDGKIERGVENYDEIGEVRTYVYYPPQFEPVVDSDATGLSEIFTETLREEVKKEYSQVAEYPELGFHFHTGRRLAKMLDYREEWLDGLPEVVIESFAGTGNPFLLGELEPGIRVLDPGAGAGLDAIIASRMIGPTGEVIGIDMTDAMVSKAQKNVRRAGVKNVFIKAGLLEDLPVPDGWADVVLSNGAVNLAPDKDKVFAELFRVLKPGGRLQIADIIVSKPVPESAKRRIELWAG